MPSDIPQHMGIQLTSLNTTCSPAKYNMYTNVTCIHICVNAAWPHMHVALIQECSGLHVGKSACMLCPEAATNM